MLRQPRLPKGKRREALPSCVHAEIRAAVNREARRFNCSRSFVVATALAHVFSIDITTYRELRSNNGR